VIVLCVGPPAHTLAKGQSSPEQKEQEAHEIRERYFRSRQRVPSKVLSAPKYLLFPIKYPTKKALIWAERVDLQNRVMDLFYFNDERTAGWFPNFSFGGKTAAAVGASIFHNDAWKEGKEFRLSFLYGDTDEWAMDGLARSPRFITDRLTGSLIVRAVEGKEEDFYFNVARGRTGNETSEEDRTTYDIDKAGLELDLAYELGDVSEAAVSFGFDFVDVEEGADKSVPPIPTNIEGAYGDEHYYVGGKLRLLCDTRDSDYRATRGWFVDLQTGMRWNIKGADGEGRDLSHYHWSIDLHRYLHLFSVFRSVVLRAKMAKTEPFASEDGAPFYFQPALDEDKALRGFERGRWRDRGALLFNVEYRYPIWDTWDGVVFLDEGQVFRQYEEIGLDGFKWSAGAGARFSGKNGFLFRLQAAWSEEKNPLVLFKMEQVF
jgi:outer membrane protein assembly factor BamA